MLNPFSRTELLLGRDAMERLAASRVADIYKTRVDPPARVMRRELEKRGIRKLKVVYSEEQPPRPIEDMAISCRAHCICPPGTKRHCTDRRDIPGSTAFVPSVAGLILAGEVVNSAAMDGAYQTVGRHSGIMNCTSCLSLWERRPSEARPERENKGGKPSQSPSVTALPEGEPRGVRILD